MNKITIAQIAKNISGITNKFFSLKIEIGYNCIILSNDAVV